MISIAKKVFNMDIDEFMDMSYVLFVMMLQDYNITNEYKDKSVPGGSGRALAGMLGK